jgi:hypothetical protein
MVNSRRVSNAQGLDGRELVEFAHGIMRLFTVGRGSLRYNPQAAMLHHWAGRLEDLGEGECYKDSNFHWFVSDALRICYEPDQEQV